MSSPRRGGASSAVAALRQGPDAVDGAMRARLHVYDLGADLMGKALECRVHHTWRATR